MNHHKARQPLKIPFILIPVLLMIIDSCTGQKKVVPVTFTKSDQVFTPVLTIQVALGDLDGDGDLDAVYANHSRFESKVLINDGNGYFTDSGQKLTQHGHGVGVEDLDGDGDLDIFITCAGARDENGISRNKPSKIYFNDGKGHLVDSGQDLGDTELSGNGIQLIDIDNDGDLDAHVFYYKVSATPFYHHIYLNDGKGFFERSDIELPEGTKCFWGYLNRDEYLDILAIVWDKGLCVLLNDGNSIFTKSWEYRDSAFRYGDATLADFDSDGDMDLMYANREGNQNDSTRVFMNIGLGQFEESRKKYNPVKLPELYHCDFNNDGAMDVYLEPYRDDILIWLNDGKGHFLDLGIKLQEECIAVGDLDGDGDKDIIGIHSVWFNQGK